MRLNGLELLAIAAVAALAAAMAILNAHVPVLTVPLAALLVFVLPGYAICAALFPSSADESGNGASMRGSDRVALTLGLSIAVCALCGLIISQFMPLSRSVWGVALAGITIVASLLAIWRLRPSGPRIPRVRLGAVLVFLIALAIGAAAITLDVVSAQQAKHPGFTQLWMVPGPRAGVVRIGVISHEHEARRYSLRLSVGGRRLKQWSLRLSPGQHWQVRHTVRAKPGTRLNAVLRSTQGVTSHRYRAVYLWMRPR